MNKKCPLTIKNENLVRVRENERYILDSLVALYNRFTTPIFNRTDTTYRKYEVPKANPKSLKQKVELFYDRKYHAFRHEALTDLVEDKPIHEQTPFWEKDAFKVLSKAHRRAFSLDVIDAYLRAGDLASADIVYARLDWRGKKVAKDYEGNVLHLIKKMKNQDLAEQLMPHFKKLSDIDNVS